MPALSCCLSPGAPATHHCRQQNNVRSGSTHLAYKLEVPHEPGPAQRTFNVEAEGSLVLSIKVRGA